MQTWLSIEEDDVSVLEVPLHNITYLQLVCVFNPSFHIQKELISIILEKIHCSWIDVSTIAY